MIKYSRITNLHFVGIGGAGMSGIAEVMHNMGFSITGSDLVESDSVRRLKKLGLKIYIGHHRDNVKDAGVVVYSSAIDKSNEEVTQALASKIPVIPRAEMLAELMRMKFSIAVAGTHGKTTTTSMIATLLRGAGLDPTFVVGGKLRIVGSGAKLGSSEYLVTEADESDGSFLKLFPTIALITNIEDDHLDFYGSIRRLNKAFLDFANKVPFYGSVILNQDCRSTRKILPFINKKIVTFGISKEAAIRAENIVTSAFQSNFDLLVESNHLGSVKIPAGGEHNIINALAAIAAGVEIGIAPRVIIDSLGEFSLPNRRFHALYRNDKCVVIDDYAHHPTEVKVTLNTLRQDRYKRITAVFQPHRYTRLKILMKGFSKAFRMADRVIIAKLYAANQQPIKNINGAVLARNIRKNGHQDVQYIEASGRIVDHLIAEVKDGDAVIFLSAGDLSDTAHALANRMEAVRK